MIPGAVGKSDGHRWAGFIVVLVVAPQHFLVQREPVLKSMTGGSNPHQRFASQAIVLDPFELGPIDRQTAGEQDRHVTTGQVLQSRNIAVGFAKGVAAFHVKMFMEIFLQKRNEASDSYSSDPEMRQILSGPVCNCRAGPGTPPSFQITSGSSGSS